MAKAAATSPALSAASRVIVLHGKDRMKADDHLRVLRTALTKVHGADGVDTVRFDGAQGPRIIADVLDEARSFGLMQQHKIILVDNADLLLKSDDDDAPASAPSKSKPRRGHAPASPRDLLESYAAEPSSGATLVLRAATWRTGNLDKAILAIASGGGSILKCDPLDPFEAIAWAIDRAKHHKTSINRDTAAMLIDAIGTDSGRIDGELAKLALAAGGTGQPITPDLITQLVGISRQEEFWAIQAALVQPYAGDTLAQLTQLLDVSRHDPVPIGFAYLEMARKIHLASRGLAQGINQSQLLGALKIWGPQKDLMQTGIMNMARALGPSGGLRLFSMTINSDMHNKSGLGDPVRNLEVLTVRFAAAAARAARR